jgi:hypothetical protein
VVHVYYDFALQGRRLSIVYERVLGLGLIVRHLYYDFALKGRRFRVV